jgi:hypothetical protein
MKMLNRSSTIAALISIAVSAVSAVHAAPLTGARITHIVNDVRTIEGANPPRPARLHEMVAPGAAVRTGIDSRSELLFTDQTITRLGANTHFTVNEGSREVSLRQGTILVQLPKGSGGAKIQTAAITAAISGSTVLFEHGKNFTTIWVIEVKHPLFLTLNSDKTRKKTPVTSGFWVRLPNDATVIPEPREFDVAEFVRKSILFNGEWGTILEGTEIAAIIAAQRKKFFGEDSGPTGADILPFLSAFGFGNFPAGVSGGSSASGTVTSVTLPNGRVALFDGFGRFIRFQ